MRIRPRAMTAEVAEHLVSHSLRPPHRRPQFVVVVLSGRSRRKPLPQLQRLQRAKPHLLLLLLLLLLPLLFRWQRRQQLRQQRRPWKCLQLGLVVP